MRGDRTVYRLRATTTDDDFGNPARNWGAASRARIDFCQLEPVAGDEETVARETVVSRWRLRCPSPVDLVSSDRIEAGGLVYEIDSEVQVYGIPPRGYTTALLSRSA